MYLLIPLFFFVFSCTTGSQKRSSFGSKAYQKIYVSACPKEAECSESAVFKIADFICREKEMDGAHTFKLMNTPPSNKTKIRVCELKEDLGNHRSHCDWMNAEISENEKATRFFSEITCQQGMQTHHTTYKKFYF